MTYIRQFIKGVDGAQRCEHCPDSPVITIEDHPTLKRHVSLCRSCTAKDLEENPRLLAMVVAVLVERSGQGVKA